MNSLLVVILTLIITSPAAIDAKAQAKKRGVDESLGYNQPNQLLLLSTLANQIHPHGIVASGLPAEIPFIGGHDLNPLGAQLQDYSLSSSNIGDYTALPVSNIPSGNIAPGNAPSSTTTKPVAPVSVPSTTSAPQQTQAQPQSNAVAASTAVAGPATITVPAIASATLQLQVPAQVQTIQTSSVQQQAAPASVQQQAATTPVQTAPAVQNVGKGSTASVSGSVNTQQVQQQTQNTQQNVPIQPIPTSTITPSQEVNQVGQQGIPYEYIQNLQLNQAHGGLEQDIANLAQVDSSLQFVQQTPIIKYINIETFPLSQHYIGLQQGIYGSPLDQKPLLDNYRPSHQTLPGLEYANLNSAFSGLSSNAKLLTYE